MATKLTQKYKRGIKNVKKYNSVTRRIFRNKYRHMQVLKHNLYWRDDDKACYENMHGTNVNTSSKGECGWYVNDKKKISDNYDDVKKH